MNEKLKMTDNNAEVIRMKRKYQWILCAGLIIFVIAAFCVLVSKDNKEEVKGAFVREGGYQSECLYQSARKCMSCASRDLNKGYHVPVLHRQGFGTENKESKCLSFYRKS